jgi:hypothetical protein
VIPNLWSILNTMTLETKINPVTVSRIIHVSQGYKSQYLINVVSNLSPMVYYLAIDSFLGAAALQGWSWVGGLLMTSA